MIGALYLQTDHFKLCVVAVAGRRREGTRGVELAQFQGGFEMTMSADRSLKALVSGTVVVLVVLFLPLSAASQEPSAETEGTPPTVKPKDQTVDATEGVPKKIKLELEGAAEGVTYEYVIGDPKNGQLDGDGPEVTYTGKKAGEDEFTFKVKIADKESESATVKVTVAEVANPVVKEQEIEVVEDLEKAFALQIEYEGNKDNLDYSVVKGKGPNHGIVPTSGKAKESITFDATEKNYTGSDEFQVTVKDRVTEKESKPATIKVKIVSPPTEIAKLVQEAKDELPGQYDPANIRTTANCNIRSAQVNGTTTLTHSCNPRGITVSADQVSTVVVELPEGVRRVSTTANETWSFWELDSHAVVYSHGKKRAAKKKEGSQASTGGPQQQQEQQQQDSQPTPQEGTDVEILKLSDTKHCREGAPLGVC